MHKNTQLNLQTEASMFEKGWGLIVHLTIRKSHLDGRSGRFNKA